MDDITHFVNSPVGLLLVGSLVSGLIVQYIVAHWQKNNWIFQQQFTDRKIRGDKLLDEQYGLLEEMNNAVAKMLTYSQGLVVLHSKNSPVNQMSGEIDAYNKANDEWQINARGFKLQLQIYFDTHSLEQWAFIIEQFDELDRNIYYMIKGEKNSEDCYKLIKGTEQAAGKLFHKMHSNYSASKKQLIDICFDMADTFDY